MAHIAAALIVPVVVACASGVVGAAVGLYAPMLDIRHRKTEEERAPASVPRGYDHIGDTPAMLTTAGAGAVVSAVAGGVAAAVPAATPSSVLFVVGATNVAIAAASVGFTRWLTAL